MCQISSKPCLTIKLCIKPPLAFYCCSETLRSLDARREQTERFQSLLSFQSQDASASLPIGYGNNVHSRVPVEPVAETLQAPKTVSPSPLESSEAERTFSVSFYCSDFFLRWMASSVSIKFETH